MVKNVFIICFLIFIMIFTSGYALNESIAVVSYQPNVDRLEVLFKKCFCNEKGVIFTKVPRGLVVSIDEKHFFSEGNSKLKQSSLDTLNTISILLSSIKNYCIVEDHTVGNLPIEGEYASDLELSMVRASNIAEYLMVKGKIPRDRIFALGYGSFMPFRDNVSRELGMDKRIDFVILEYEANR